MGAGLRLLTFFRAVAEWSEPTKWTCSHVWVWLGELVFGFGLGESGFVSFCLLLRLDSDEFVTTAQ